MSLLATEGVDTAAKAGEGLSLAEQVGGGGRAKGDDDFGADYVDLLEEERRAGVGFVRLGGAVAGRAALDHIGDVDLFALQSHGGDHVVEELAGLADEGDALGVFIGAWAFADEHEAGVGGAVAEDDLVAAGMEGAARAVADLFADEREGGGGTIGFPAIEGRWACGRRAEDGLRRWRYLVLMSGTGVCRCRTDAGSCSQGLGGLDAVAGSTGRR